MDALVGARRLGAAWFGGMAVLWASAAFAQNTSLATAASLGTGQPPAVFTLSPATPERWYVFKAQTYRSYCIEVLPDPSHAGAADVLVELTSGGYTTTFTTKPFNQVWDPHPGDRGAAYCDAIWNSNAVVSLRILQQGASVGGTTTHQVRIVETSLFAPRFEVDVRRGVDSAVVLSNTTSATFMVSVTLFDQAGHTLLSPPQIDFNLVPYGSTEVVVSGTGLTRAVGSIVISHLGGLGAVAADLQMVRPQGLTSVPFRPREDYHD
jgi:hypothetical protein